MWGPTLIKAAFKEEIKTERSSVAISFYSYAGDVHMLSFCPGDSSIKYLNAVCDNKLNQVTKNLILKYYHILETNIYIKKKRETKSSSIKYLLSGKYYYQGPSKKAA